ncbi:hypothetical protein ACLOJK_012158 [Asimina triloba]
MASAASVFHPFSIRKCCLNSASTLFTPKPTPSSFIYIPSKNPKPLPFFSLSLAFSSDKLPLSRRSFTALVTRTSEWAPQQGKEAEFDWEGAEDEEGPEASSSDWEGEGKVDEEMESDDDEGEESYVEEEEDGGKESYAPPSEEAKLFVGNLPFDVESADLAALFQKAGIVETAEISSNHYVIYNRATDKSRGFGFVEMSTVEEAEKAVEMFNRYVHTAVTLLISFSARQIILKLKKDLKGKLLTVNKASPRGGRVEQSSREFSPSFKVYVGNLPWQVDDARLGQVFREHGKVVDARVVCDRETGRSRGFGFVTMSTRAELDGAIEALDGQVPPSGALFYVLCISSLLSLRTSKVVDFGRKGAQSVRSRGKTA